MALRKMGVGVLALRATASQCFTSGWGGTYTCVHACMGRGRAVCECVCVCAHGLYAADCSLASKQAGTSVMLRSCGGHEGQEWRGRGDARCLAAEEGQKPTNICCFGGFWAARTCTTARLLDAGALLLLLLGTAIAAAGGLLLLHAPQRAKDVILLCAAK